MTAPDPDRLRTLLQGARSAEAERRAKDAGRRFNVFDAIAMVDDEIRHSRFLAFLLDPSAAHDQGAKFLQSFLQLIGSRIPETDAVARACIQEPLKNARVRTEVALGDLGRMDLVIYLPERRVICIENKVWAAEQDHQIERYQHWLLVAPEARDGRLIVFLTPGGYQPSTAMPANQPAPFVRSLSYADLADWLEGFANSLPPPVDVVLKMYKMICRRLGGLQMPYDENDRIDAVLNSDFETALNLVERIDGKKEHIVRAFWVAVQEDIKKRLQAAGIAKCWTVKFAGRPSHPIEQLGIVPAPCNGSEFGDPVWTPDGAYVMAEALGTTGDTCCFGIRAPDSSLPGHSEITRSLSDKGFRSNRWWAGYMVLKLPDGWVPIPSSTSVTVEHYKKLNDDHINPEHPMAAAVGQVLWDLFDEYRDQLERANAQVLAGVPTA